METKTKTLLRVLAGTIVVLLPLILAAWFVPPDFPMLLRQILLTAWGVGAILVAERYFFSQTWQKAVIALGFVVPRWRAVWVALLVSVPMWIFIPLYTRFNGIQVSLYPNWLELLIGVILLNGIAEEAIHRGFVFGNLRHERSFIAAASISALIFAAQHFYLIVSVGLTTGLSTVLLATLLAFPLAYLFECGGNSIGAPAIIHTSTNAPVLLLALPPTIATSVLMPYMGVLVLCLYLVFAFRKYLSEPSPVEPQLRPAVE